MQDLRFTKNYTATYKICLVAGLLPSAVAYHFEEPYKFIASYCSKYYYATMKYYCSIAYATYHIKLPSF